MSMDLDFWRYEDGAEEDHKAVYEAACCNGKNVNGLEELPIGEIMARVAEEFSGWTQNSETSFEKDDCGAFEVFTTQQIVRFDCTRMLETDLNKLIDIMLEFDCPLYDPQLGERFD